MALQIWLPLNGNLNNQGLSDVIFTNTNATLNSSGKIGKCYSFDGVDARISSDEFICKPPLSMCAWIKPDAATIARTTTTYILSYNLNSEGTAGHILGIGIYPDKYGAGKLAVWANGGTAPCPLVMTADTWYHITATLNENNIVTVYVNGQQIYSDCINTDMPTSNFITLGGRSKSGKGGAAAAAYYYSGQINDFRFYNHCLSKKEVAEIAKGLLLHYQLKTKHENTLALTNCYQQPQFNTGNSGGGWNHWGRTGANGTYGQTTDKNYIFNSLNTYAHWVANAASATGEYLLYQSPAFDGGIRSLQCIVKEENSSVINESIIFPAWNARKGGTASNLWTSITPLSNGFYLCKCEGISQDGSNDLVGIYVTPGYKVYFSECYLENNTNICSDLFFWEENNNIEYDCSGFENHGMRTEGITLDNNSICYNACQKFTTTDYIYCGTAVKPTDALTANIWCYMEIWSGETRPFSCTENGGWNIESLSDGYIYFPVYYNSSGGYIQTPKTIKWTDLSPGWHMFTGTFNGFQSKLYIDGQLKAATTPVSTKTTIKYHATNGLFIHGEATTSPDTPATNYSECKMSDARIYVTALTDDQIKELYEVGASISKDGTLWGYELVEE